eukprot:6327890-Pyramimonas_sp.AAC.1
MAPLRGARDAHRRGPPPRRAVYEGYKHMSPHEAAVGELLLSGAAARFVTRITRITCITCIPHASYDNVYAGAEAAVGQLLLPGAAVHSVRGRPRGGVRVARGQERRPPRGGAARAAVPTGGGRPSRRAAHNRDGVPRQRRGGAVRVVLRQGDGTGE